MKIVLRIPFAFVNFLGNSIEFHSVIAMEIYLEFWFNNLFANCLNNSNNIYAASQSGTLSQINIFFIFWQFFGNSLFLSLKLSFYSNLTSIRHTFGNLTGNYFRQYIYGFFFRFITSLTISLEIKNFPMGLLKHWNIELPIDHRNSERSCHREN